MTLPMLATLAKEPFDDPDWIFEIKWDGYRCLAEKKTKVVLVSRNQKLFNAKFPAIAKELSLFPSKFILDGEIVILDQKGRSQFQALQNYEEGSEPKAYYYVFDILALEGKPLMHLPLLERKKILSSLLKKRKGKYVRLSEHIEEKGRAFFKKAQQKGWEGIIGKRKNSPYLFARTREWLKFKSKLGQEVVIGGFTEPKGERPYFGALLVGVYDKKTLIYSGHVGTGFDRIGLQKLYQKMQPLIRKTSPFQIAPTPNAKVTWISPKLICEVAFAEWTEDKIMRQPVFKGMRFDKKAIEVVREAF